MKSRRVWAIRSFLAVLAILMVFPGAALAQAPPAGAPPGGPNPMKAPFAPFHMIGNIYYVGSAGLACYIIKTPKGEILLDSGYPDMASQIEGNIQA